MCVGARAASSITPTGAVKTKPYKPRRVPLPTIFEEVSENCLSSLPQLPKDMQELLVDPLRLVDCATDAQKVVHNLKSAGKRDRSLMLAWLGNSLRLMAFSEGASVVVLAAIDVAVGHDRNRFVDIFRGHVLELSTSQYGHEVLMKLIETLPPYLLGFVIDEMSGWAVALAQHKYGCHVLGSIVTHSSLSMTSELAAEIAEEASRLACDWQGKDVLQQLLEYGSSEYRSAIIQKLMPQLPKLSVDRSAAHVVKQAFQFADQSEKQMLAHALLQASKSISTVDIACSRGGSSILQEINFLGLCRTEFHLRLIDALPRLAKCRFGRRIAVCFGLQ